jgi:hypothetical protein
MKQYACKPHFSTLLSVFTLTVLAFFFNFSKCTAERVNPAIFRNYIKPNSNVNGENCGSSGSPPINNGKPE